MTDEAVETVRAALADSYLTSDKRWKTRLALDSLEAENERLRGELGWYAQDFHDRYHGDAGLDWTACERGRCLQTRQALGEEAGDVDDGHAEDAAEEEAKR